MPTEAEIEVKVLERLSASIGAVAVHELIGICLRDAPAGIADCRRGLEQNDLALARRAAHDLKSKSATLGARRFAQLCADTEAAARIGDAGQLREMLPQLEARLTLVLGELGKAGEQLRS